MPLNSKISKLLRLLFCLVFALSVVFSRYSYAAVYDGVRSMSYDSGKEMCANNDYALSKFDPLLLNDKTSSWELTNANCLAFAGSYGAAIVAQQLISWRWACKSSSANTPAVTRGAPALEDGAMGPALPPYPTPALPLRVAAFFSSCVAFGVDVSTATAGCVVVAPSTVPNNPYLCGGLTAAGADQTKCCIAAGVLAATVASSVAALNIIWDKSRITYENARVCGHNWNQWKKDEETGEMMKEKGPYQICLKQLFESDGKIGSNCSEILSKAKDVGKVDQYIQLSKDCLNSAFSGSNPSSGCSTNDKFPSKISLDNKYYREYIYGGIEFKDNGNNACKNPWGSEKSKRRKYLGYDDDEQKYYMTGGGSAPVFACHRFLSDGVNENTQKAYDCCKKRSQTTICIQNRSGLGEVLGSYQHKICKVGEFCDIEDIKFETFESRVSSNYICAKTYSLCPYNHLLGGGSEKRKISSDPNRYGAAENYCQYMNHCTKLPILPYVYSSNLDGAWVSGACRDLKGDSQNVYGFSTQVIPTNTRHFSAPMAQCFKESVANLFLNRAGETKCESPSEAADSTGYCSSGYIYKKGDLLPGDSFFAKMQKNLKTAIKMGLVVSIVAFGYSILLAVPKTDTFNKKALLTYIVKISLVMYFAIGNAWQYGFMDGVLGFSGAMSDLVFKLDESGDPATLDGCQFPRFNYADTDEATRYNNPKYPPGSEYLRIWDTLDCKLARALGYGPEVSVPNLFFMILGGFLDFGAGILFVLGSLFLAFVMLMVVCRSLHIFLMSTTAVILLLYVSPITITCAMFARTKGIFDGWKKQLMGLSLQPMVLFAYLAVMISVFDHAIIGEVRFSGDGKSEPKKIICDNSSIGDVLVADPLVNGKINSSGNSTSIYCIFRTADIKTFHGLEVIGIGLPVLMSMTKAKVMTIIKSAMIMFIFLQFLDKISSLATELVGGAKLDSGFNAATVGKMARGLGGAMKSLQDRGLGAMSKLGGAALRKAGEAYGGAKDGVRAAGKKSKKSEGGGGGGGGAGGGGDDGGPGDHATDSFGGGSKPTSGGVPKPEKFKPTLESISEEGEEDEDEDEDTGDKEPETVQRPNIPSDPEPEKEKFKPSLLAISEGDESEDDDKDSGSKTPLLAISEGDESEDDEKDSGSKDSLLAISEGDEGEDDDDESKSGSTLDSISESDESEEIERPVISEEDSKVEQNVESSESTTTELPKASDGESSSASQQVSVSESVEEISSESEGEENNSDSNSESEEPEDSTDSNSESGESETDSDISDSDSDSGESVSSSTSSNSSKSSSSSKQDFVVRRASGSFEKIEQKLAPVENPNQYSHVKSKTDTGQSKSSKSSNKSGSGGSSSRSSSISSNKSSNSKSSQKSGFGSSSSRFKPDKK
jgi:type IV secretory pathway VirB6-like protein